MTLQWYLLRQLGLSLVMALFGIAFLVLPALLVSALNRLAGVPLSALLGFLPLLAVGLVPYMLPMAFLLAVVATYGSLAQDNEWTAIRMAGIHPFRILLPGLLVAGGLWAGTQWVVATLAPEWTYRQSQYKIDALVGAFKRLRPGRTEIEIGRFFLSSAGRDQNSFLQALVQIPGRKGEQGLRVVADRVDLWFEGDVLWYRLERPRAVDGRMDSKADLYTRSLPLDELITQVPQERSAPKFRTSADLQRAIDTGSAAPAQVHLYAFEIQRRRALAASYLVFLFLGVPTGLLMRRGTQLAALAAAVGYAFLYYVLFMRLSKELAVHGAVPVLVAAWTVDLVGLAVGAWLLKRALRE